MTKQRKLWIIKIVNWYLDGLISLDELDLFYKKNPYYNDMKLVNWAFDNRDRYI